MRCRNLPSVLEACNSTSRQNYEPVSYKRHIPCLGASSLSLSVRSYSGVFLAPSSLVIQRDIRNKTQKKSYFK